MDELVRKIDAVSKVMYQLQGKAIVDSMHTGYELLYPDAIIARIASFKSYMSRNFPEFLDLLNVVFSDKDFECISPRDSESHPVISSPFGCFGLPPSEIIFSLFTTALIKIYLFSLDKGEEEYIRVVQENFEELKKALRGEPISAYEIKGLALLHVPANSLISTPWGDIYPAPTITKYYTQPAMSKALTRSLLIERKSITVKFDRGNIQGVEFASSQDADSKVAYLLPLACALASKDSRNPVSPIITWSTYLFPFQGDIECSTRLLGPVINTDSDPNESLENIEEWVRIVEQAHTPSVDIAAKRLVSAVAHRTDVTDALIDVVMIWENLLGTSNEVTFRVSASLAKLIEKDPNKRIALKKSLSKIYSVRSRIVHGSSVSVQEVTSAYSDAIDATIRALRECYLKGSDWLSLSSTERSDKVLLTWP